MVSMPKPKARAVEPTDKAMLFPLSATSAEELRRTAARLADWVDAQSGGDLRDLAYTLARRRGHRPMRTTVSAGTREELIKATRMIVVLSIVLGLLIGLMDWLLQLGLVQGIAQLAR